MQQNILEEMTQSSATATLCTGWAEYHQDRQRTHEEVCHYDMQFVEDGTGRMDAYPVLPGIELIFIRFTTVGNLPKTDRQPGAIEINHCHSGRFECELPGGRAAFLGPHDFSISDMGAPPVFCRFAMGGYCGSSLVVEPCRATMSLQQFLGPQAPDCAALFSKLLAGQGMLLLRANAALQRFFQSLYEAPFNGRDAFFKLKAAELILLLTNLSPQKPQNTSIAYFNRDLLQRVQAVERELTQDLRKHIALRQLAARYQIGETTLKRRFVQIYGQPPYQYLRRRRMEYAANLLQTGELSVTQVAAEVGYLNNSKFSAAFYAQYQVSPIQYKKGIRME
ncbi:MAG: hypothetical protein PWQ08_1135 [Clostridiales bacterium]|nr:hypothetical protein [Clostridiales bacterium]